MRIGQKNRKYRCGKCKRAMTFKGKTKDGRKIYVCTARVLEDKETGYRYRCNTRLLVRDLIIKKPPKPPKTKKKL